MPDKMTWHGRPILETQPKQANEIFYFKDLKQGDKFEFEKSVTRPPVPLINEPCPYRGPLIKVGANQFRAACEILYNPKIYEALAMERVKRWHR